MPRIFDRILVPPAVIRELNHPKTPPQVAAWARDLPEWITVRAPHSDLHLGIGPGEDEAISLAIELDRCAVLMDDRKAVIAAKSRGLLVFGTLAILDAADARGWLDFEAAVSRLKSTSFYIDDVLLETALSAVRARKKL